MLCRIRRINRTLRITQGIPRLLFTLLVETTDVPITIVKEVVEAAITIVAVGQFMIAAEAVLLVAIGTGTPTIK